MFCVNCGEQLPEGARFCLKCGTPLGGGTAAATAPEYEYDEWVWSPEAKWMQNKWWVKVGSGDYSMDDAQKLAWHYLSDAIRENMQEVCDNGWKPVQSPGPECIEVGVFEASPRRSGFGHLMTAVASSGASLVVDRFVKNQYVTVGSVRVPIRRKKT